MKQVTKKKQEKVLHMNYVYVVGVARSSSFVFICEEKLRAQRDDKQTPNSMI